MNPFAPNPNPFQSLPQNLAPQAPESAPAPFEIPKVEDLGPSPFAQPIDLKQITENITYDRPLALVIPHRERYPGYDFRIINDTPQEMAQALMKGWMRVDDPWLVSQFEGKVSGTDKTGRITKLVLMGRPKLATQIVARRNAAEIQRIYAAMNPKERQLTIDPKYASVARSESKAYFGGRFMQIKLP